MRTHIFLALATVGGIAATALPAHAQQSVVMSPESAAQAIAEIRSQMSAEVMDLNVIREGIGALGVSGEKLLAELHRRTQAEIRGALTDGTLSEGLRSLLTRELEAAPAQAEREARNYKYRFVLLAPKLNTLEACRKRTAPKPSDSAEQAEAKREACKSQDQDARAFINLVLEAIEKSEQSRHAARRKWIQDLDLDFTACPKGVYKNWIGAEGAFRLDVLEEKVLASWLLTGGVARGPLRIRCRAIPSSSSERPHLKYAQKSHELEVVYGAQGWEFPDAGAMKSLIRLEASKTLPKVAGDVPPDESLSPDEAFEPAGDTPTAPAR